MRMGMFYLFFLCGILKFLPNAFSKENIVFDADSPFDIYDNLNDVSGDIYQESEKFKIDRLMEEDPEEYDLADIMQLSTAEEVYDIDKYSELEKMEFVDLHNLYRSNQTKPIPKGSDIQYVEWNNTLAWAADDYLRKCQFKHGFGEHDNMTGKQGQNLYTGPSMIPSRPMYLWYEEYKYYHFNNLTCKKPYPQYMCNHFVQLLWYNSRHVGCARRSYCFPTEKWRKLVNCHYYHYGNAVGPGIRIYRYGWPCTRCTLPDGNLCFHNLCISKRICSSSNLDCECKLKCKNCAKPNPKTCRCETCKLGWDWEDCSYPCLNIYNIEMKKANACETYGLTKFQCAQEEYKNMCRKQCKTCKPVDETKKAELCCGGKICPQHFTLDKHCKCQLDCPSPLCMYPPSTTTKYPVVLDPQKGESKRTKDMTETSTRENKVTKENKSKPTDKGKKSVVKKETTPVVPVYPQNVQVSSSMNRYIAPLHGYLIILLPIIAYYCTIS